MLKNLKNYIKPDTLQQAADLIKSDNTKIVAGATSLIKSGNSNIETLVDINDLGLNKINVSENYITIDSCCPINDLMYHKKLNNLFNNELYNCCVNCAAEPLRNLITVGGNIYQVYPWSNLPPFLLVLDTEIVTNKNRNIYITDFYKKHPKLVLDTDEIITQIKIKNNINNLKLGFEQFSKTSFDYSLVTISISFNFNNQKLNDLKIAVGSLTPVPYRLYDIEKKYSGIILNNNLLNDLKKEIYDTVKVNKDFRCDIKYKKKLVSRLVIKKISELTGVEL
jgi:carbon-monoxide dehydrogenase medium subunit